MIELALRLKQEQELAALRERRRIHGNITVWSVLFGTAVGPIALATAEGHVPHAVIFIGAWLCIASTLVGWISAMLE